MCWRSHACGLFRSSRKWLKHPIREINTMARVATLAMSLSLAIENLPLEQGVNTAWARMRATR